MLLTTSEQLRVSLKAPAAEVDLLPGPSIGVDYVQIAQGGLLVPLRKPGALAPLAAALRAAGSRDVVVMTVRLTGVDVSDDRSRSVELSDEERRLFTSAAL